MSQNEFCAFIYFIYLRVCFSDSKWRHQQLMYVYSWPYNNIDCVKTKIQIGQWISKWLSLITMSLICGVVANYYIASHRWETRGVHSHSRDEFSPAVQHPLIHLIYCAIWKKLWCNQLQIVLPIDFVCISSGGSIRGRWGRLPLS